jgi:N6-L-threonylcarbamoyladenine synthase
MSKSKHDYHKKHKSYKNKNIPHNTYVLHLDGTPLMPSTRGNMIKNRLDNGLAKIVNHNPFTIQLLYETTKYTQDISLGIDCGSRYVGVSATSKEREYYSSECELRIDISENIADRAMMRRSRRSRKTRYRPPRWNNRKGIDLSPTHKHKIESHEKIIDKIKKLLPIKDIVIESATFDVQEMKESKLTKEGFKRTRDALFHHDNHECQICHSTKNLQTHHLESRKTGGNSMSNLITLCEDCHKKYHSGELDIYLKRKDKSYRDSAFMNTMNARLYNTLVDRYGEDSVHKTFGYYTYNTRKELNIDKSHRNDARVISGNPLAKVSMNTYKQKEVRTKNRQIHKMNYSKGNIRKNNQSPKYVQGYQLFDKVRVNLDVLTDKWKDKLKKIYGDNIKVVEGFVTARRTAGYFEISDIDGNAISNSLSCKKIDKINHRRSTICQRIKNINHNNERK